VVLSERQVRRLAHRDLEVALRSELARESRRRSDDAKRRARDVVGALEDRVRAGGYRGKSRTEIATAWPKKRGWLLRRLTPEEIRRLELVGLSDEEVDAIQMVGIPSDMVAYLLSFGLTDADPTGHESHPADGAR
jgi:hypothetical protein